MAAEGKAVVPHVHITPMRASRALSLRFLATKFGLGMDAFTVRPSCHMLLANDSHCAHSSAGFSLGMDAITLRPLPLLTLCELPVQG